ncbi:MAG: hypothetical protein AAGM40_29785, partial [Cyanobacteria bacterium J06573_2]
FIDSDSLSLDKLLESIKVIDKFFIPLLSIYPNALSVVTSDTLNNPKRKIESTSTIRSIFSILNLLGIFI